MEDSVVQELVVGIVLLSVVWLQELTVGTVFDSVDLDLDSEDWVPVVFDSVVFDSVFLVVDAPQVLLLDGKEEVVLISLVLLLEPQLS